MPPPFQIAVWDLRQQRQVHFFRAHEQAVKCIAIDPNEEFFVTGSVSGDIKVSLTWLVKSYALLNARQRQDSAREHRE